MTDECPNPHVHGRPFRYCPYCPWRESDPPTPERNETEMTENTCPDCGPSGAALIAEERLRQKQAEGYNDAHDAAHGAAHFIQAGSAYLCGDRDLWPWDAACTWKPHGVHRDVVRAGALFQVAVDLGYSEAQMFVDRCAELLDAMAAPGGTEEKA